MLAASGGAAVAASTGRPCRLPLDTVREHLKHDAVFWQAVYRNCIDTTEVIGRWGHALASQPLALRVALSVELMVDVQRSMRIVLPSQAAHARLLGTSRESVARALAELEAAGCIVRRQRRSCELQREAMQAWLAQAAKVSLPNRGSPTAAPS